MSLVYFNTETGLRQVEYQAYPPFFQKDKVNSSSYTHTGCSIPHKYHNISYSAFLTRKVSEYILNLDRFMFYLYIHKAVYI